MSRRKGKEPVSGAPAARAYAAKEYEAYIEGLESGLNLAGAQLARVEALRAAMGMQRARVGTRNVIEDAKEFEAYILTGERRSPAEEAATDETG